ncbi:hypothetical protein DSBG_1566 [Desulfosporosinus sp. BG]|nr:hypothetical protein DSBG_1566 [Desulfosporosinus sp. BG]
MRVLLVFILETFRNSGIIFGNGSLQNKQIIIVNSDRMGVGELARFLH